MTSVFGTTVHRRARDRATPQMAYDMGVNYAKTMFGSAGEGGGAQKTGANERSGTAFGQKVNVNDAQPGPTQGQTR